MESQNLHLESFKSDSLIPEERVSPHTPLHEKLQNQALHFVGKPYYLPPRPSPQRQSLSIVSDGCLA